MLRLGQQVDTTFIGLPCRVDDYIGGGGQGEVYQAELDSRPVALKWYYQQIVNGDPELRSRLEMAIRRGAPSRHFLWPVDLATRSPPTPSDTTFGYVMPLRPPGYKGMAPLMKGSIVATFRTLATAGFELADAFQQLHSKGLCYRDINFGNVFLDPATGKILVCDNDNVDINGTPGVIRGTAMFMAPEILRGKAMPSTETDLFSLSVLLFHILLRHHPLEGRRERLIHCLDVKAQRRLHGEEPVFIFDPEDESNRPVPGEQDNALIFWDIYPTHLKRLFIRAFTSGIRDPQSGRVFESEWRDGMLQLRDAILNCPCGAQNFYDVDASPKGVVGGRCWSCRDDVALPFRVRIGRRLTMLNDDTMLFGHHLDPVDRTAFDTPVAQVERRPDQPEVQGLKNLSEQPWTTTRGDGKRGEVPPGMRIRLDAGLRIGFWSAGARRRIEGEIVK